MATPKVGQGSSTQIAAFFLERRGHTASTMALRLKCLSMACYAIDHHVAGRHPRVTGNAALTLEEEASAPFFPPSTPPHILRGPFPGSKQHGDHARLILLVRGLTWNQPFHYLPRGWLPEHFCDGGHPRELVRAVAARLWQQALGMRQPLGCWQCEPSGFELGEHVAF